MYMHIGDFVDCMWSAKAVLKAKAKDKATVGL